jgi:hypothetical protein
LNQIRFENPAGFPSGEYLAQILETGEVVPKASPTLSFGQSGTNFVLSWSSDFTLQTATNVSGPYEDIPATSPFTDELPESPERYFRLRQLKFQSFPKSQRCISIFFPDTFSIKTRLQNCAKKYLDPTGCSRRWNCFSREQTEHCFHPR